MSATGSTGLVDRGLGAMVTISVMISPARWRHGQRTSLSLC
jgi:hypothetical protein